MTKKPGSVMSVSWHGAFEGYFICILNLLIWNLSKFLLGNSIQRKHKYEKASPSLQLFQSGRKTDFGYETSMQKGRSELGDPASQTVLTVRSSKGPYLPLQGVTSRPGCLVLQCWASSSAVTIALHVDHYYRLSSS